LIHVETILALLVALVGPSAGSPAGLEPVAAAIAEEAAGAPLWPGDEGVRRTALVLLAIGVHESGFRPAVRSCAVRGDGGKSLGAYQLFGRWAWGGLEPDAVCSSDALQAHLALRVLARHRERGVASEAGLLRAYASGSAGKDTRAGRELAATLARATRVAGAL
jgi:hypothetical protein